MTKKMMEAKFDFDDFIKQYKMVSDMGNMGSVMKLMPGILSCIVGMGFRWYQDLSIRCLLNV